MEDDEGAHPTHDSLSESKNLSRANRSPTHSKESSEEQEDSESETEEELQEGAEEEREESLDDVFEISEPIDFDSGEINLTLSSGEILPQVRDVTMDFENLEDSLGGVSNRADAPYTNISTNYAGGGENYTSEAEEGYPGEGSRASTILEETNLTDQLNSPLLRNIREDMEPLDQMTRARPTTQFEEFEKPQRDYEAMERSEDVGRPDTKRRKSEII